MKAPSIRIGQGFDVHAFATDRQLWLCGVNIPHDRGLLGHSDADVALHALSDALLGAAALRDIGYHFPDTDPRYKGADSRKLLREVVTLLADKGYGIGNVDVTIMAQKQAPPLHTTDGGKYRPRLRHRCRLRVSQGNHHRETRIYGSRRRHSSHGGHPYLSTGLKSIRFIPF